jgi:hypothetical protein
VSVTSQIPEVLDLEFVRGDEFSRRFHFTESSVDLDVSAWVMTAQVREFAEADNPTDFTVDDSDAVNGNVDITLSEAQTALLPEENEWDFQFVIDGYTITLFAGSCNVKRDVTRA